MYCFRAANIRLYDKLLLPWKAKYAAFKMKEVLYPKIGKEQKPQYNDRNNHYDSNQPEVSTALLFCRLIDVVFLILFRIFNGSGLFILFTLVFIYFHWILVCL